MTKIDGTQPRSGAEWEYARTPDIDTNYEERSQAPLTLLIRKDLVRALAGIA